ncbi:HAD family hydrolase [Collimonas pratensis]|uniref:HAD family hydrolase n=1 Tax=Collimonas pratensis TaxID=279113 RepID=UPI000782C102|nr:HAD family hydrolase [Collimonas pratensis]
MKRRLLIFDLDETLVHATTVELSHVADFVLPPYFVYKRPFLSDLLTSVAPLYDLAVWSSSSKVYVDAVVAQVFEQKFDIKFAWAVEKCVQRIDIRSNGYVYIKDLRKIQSQGYSLDQITIIDDSPEKISRQPRNHIKIEPFLGQQNDRELLAVAAKLHARSLP